MPELPEVETTRRGISEHVVGRRVSQVLVRQPTLRWPISADLAQCLTGQRISAVERRAKYLFLITTAGRVMIHLGMSGSLRVLGNTANFGKHDHVDLQFHDGTLLRYRDPRRFGSIFWLSGSEGHPLLDQLGPEPLSGDFDGDCLFTVSRRRKVPVKQFIMNSHVVVGVGNIYANEALFRAGIDPRRPAGSIARKRYMKLADEIKAVLAEAIEAGGTTLRDFVNEDGKPGYFRHELQVYGRGAQACLCCQRRLKEIRLGQRTTVFCLRCQT